ncbi:MAG: outer membrane beta-barrel protein [Roseiarcus sp.]|jgi:outer membrane immunogenic protein
MRWHLLVSAGAVALLANGAFAADLALPTHKAPPPPAFTWTGCYVGLHAGGDFGQSKWSDRAGDFIVGTTVGVNTQGAIGGGQAGCNYQLNDNFVVGVEAEIWGSGLEGTTSVSLNTGNGSRAQFKTWSDAAGDVALRAGYAIDRTLIFGKVGLAEAQYDYRTTFINTPLPAPLLTAGATHTGLLLGVGVEYALDMHWSLKGEYDYIDYGSESAEFYYKGVAEFPASFKNEENVLKVGANYRF